MKNVCAGFFNTLANKTRLKILYTLRNGEKSVNDIVKETGFEQSLVSHNLKLLRDCCFVEVNIRGKQRIYTLNKSTIVPVFELADKHISTYCGDDSHQCRVCRK